ncbi:MAG: aminotransferase class I/II-fold pyridoxal phosphate-dependent enzyme [Chloroflexi bacterium]|nr:aminotransferase class I/II-fold pyridoxal phosphate-dependent enzyme [Chloroflexota bacterium]
MKKNSVQELALFGGPPAFEETLHVGRPNIGNREKLQARINDLLDRRWLSNNGPFLIELEQRLAEFLKVDHCVAIANATIALEIAARALELQGEVILPSFTFVATAHAMQWLGITPVFCDVDPLTHNIDPAEVERLITPRTTGILGVHVWGRACNVEALNDIAQRHGLKVMFDAAHALACTHHGRIIGGFGHAEVFSFHATKFFNSFEGGAITTNDEEIAQRARSMRNFGFAGLDKVVGLGTNGKMSEISAAMGLTSLESLDEFIDVNRRNYRAYIAELDGIPGIRMIQYDPQERNNYQYIVIEVDEEKAVIDRDTVVDILHAENIRARRYFYPGCHQMEPYRSWHVPPLPETERLTQRVLQLPTGTAVTPREIEKICAIIRFAVSSSGEILKRTKRTDAD